MSMWPDMPGGLLDHVEQGPAPRRRPKVRRRGLVERTHPIERRIGQGALVAVEGDDVVGPPSLGQFEHVGPPAHVHRLACADGPEPESLGVAEVDDEHAERVGPGAGRQRSCSGPRSSSLKTALSRRCWSQARAIGVSSCGAASSGRVTRSSGGFSLIAILARTVLTRAVSDATGTSSPVTHQFVRGQGREPGLRRRHAGQVKCTSPLRSPRVSAN